MKNILLYGFIICALNSYAQENKIHFFLNPVNLELGKSFSSMGNRNVNFSHNRKITPEFGVVYDRFLGKGNWGLGVGVSLKKFKNEMKYSYEVWDCDGNLENWYSRESIMEIDAWGLRFNAFYQWKKVFIKGVLEINSPIKNRVKTSEKNLTSYNIWFCDSNSLQYQSITIENFNLRPSYRPFDYITQDLIMGYRLTDKINIALGIKIKLGNNRSIFYLEIFDNKNEDNTFTTEATVKHTVEVKNKYIMGYLGVSYDLLFSKRQKNY